MIADWLTFIEGCPRHIPDRADVETVALFGATRDQTQCALQRQRYEAAKAKARKRR